MEREFVSTSDIGTRLHPILSTLIWLVVHVMNMAEIDDMILTWLRYIDGMI